MAAQSQVANTALLVIVLLAGSTSTSAISRYCFTAGARLELIMVLCTSAVLVRTSTRY
jgi:hypothetical protein